MDDTSRTEYPSMLENLQPTQAVNVFNDRVKRIAKVNVEIADWLQERRRVEEQYVQGLRKLTHFRAPNQQSELGVFQAPWDKVIQSIDATAHSHHLFASRVEQDVEAPLRAFNQDNDMQSMNATSANLTSIARELDDAQKKFDALNKKSGKGSSQKLDGASSKLDAATQQWDSQAPFIFESLQALDEQRVNQLRDFLTQYQTHESDQAQRSQTNAAETLAALLEISTELEIASFRERTVAGNPRQERRALARPPSANAAPQQSLAPPSAIPEDTTSEHSGPSDNRSDSKHEGKPEKTESKLRSRIGTMLGRRRQSVHGSSLGSQSPSKTSGTFSRTNSSHGRPGLSPRTSTGNLGGDSANRLSILPETPTTPQHQPLQSIGEQDRQGSHDGTNGVAGWSGEAPPRSPAAGVNGSAVDVSDVPPPPGPPPPQQQDSEKKDAEGFTIPPPANDPISEAQREAAEGNDQLFKLNISSSPIAEEDPEASQAALTNVASTLTKMSGPSRKMGTLRGRRDVRNTIYNPSPTALPDLNSPNPFYVPPQQTGQAPSSPAVAALASQPSIAGTSDTQSIRSANSLGSLVHLKHPEMNGPGLNASIIETVSATFEDDKVKTAKINGEIAFSYNAESGDVGRETIRINNFPHLEAIGPNRIFVHSASPDRPDEFTLDVSHLHRTSTAFTYRVHASETDAQAPSLAAHAPLLLRPSWKPTGDKLGLLLQYSLNPACQLSSPVNLHNVVFVVTYEGTKASGVQTKPSGTHLKDKHLVYWRLGDVTLTPEPQKIICRVNGADGAEPKPGVVEARWEYSPSEGAALGSGISLAKLQDSKGKGKEVAGAQDDDDPFADGGTAEQRWTDVTLVRKVVSGKYEAV